jgi:hypothetical protein
MAAASSQPRVKSITKYGPEPGVALAPLAIALCFVRQPCRLRMTCAGEVRAGIEGASADGRE